MAAETVAPTRGTRQSAELCSVTVAKQLQNEAVVEARQVTKACVPRVRCA